MSDDETPRLLPERTSKHRCVRCLQEVEAEKFFANDFVCDECYDEAARFPLRSTPKGETPHSDDKR